MHAKRIIPCLDVNNGRVVKGTSFVNLRDAGDPVEAAIAYDKQGADELVLLDITASHEGRGTMLHIVQEVAKHIFIPFTVGGGVRTVEDINALLRAGADKVAINSAAYDNLSLITEGAKLFGSQCIVASIDCRKINGEYHCFSHNGSVDTGWLLQDWIVKVVEAGAGEILLTSVELDGTMEGYDVEMIKIATSLVNVPVIASGGAGNYEHMRKAVQEGGASAVAAASIYHFTEQTPKEAKEYLGEHGVAVRMI